MVRRVYQCFWGILLFIWAIYPGQNDFFKDVGMVVTIFGAVLVLVGWRVMAVAWFPHRPDAALASPGPR